MRKCQFSTCYDGAILWCLELGFDPPVSEREDHVVVDNAGGDSLIGLLLQLTMNNHENIMSQYLPTINITKLEERRSEMFPQQLDLVYVAPGQEMLRFWQILLEPGIFRM